MNIIEYVQNSHKKFEEEPFNHVDALVLCQISYCSLEIIAREGNMNLKRDRISLRDFYRAEYFDRLFIVDFTRDNDYHLLTAVAASRRFRDIRVKYLESSFDSDIDKQFACCIFGINSNTDFVAFRGTDSSITGWKEDFNLSFMNEVPSQKEALRVLNTYYRNSLFSVSNIIVGGHSKGGNLAVYASSFADAGIRKRISRVYSMDGPGFREEVQNSMNEIKPDLNIIKIVPEKSLIGMLMETGTNYLVVESNAFYIMQHSSYNWIIENSDFKYAGEIRKREAYINKTIQEWLLHASDSDREIMVNAIFNILLDNDIEYTSDFASASIKDVISSTRELTEEQEAVIKKLMGELVSAGIRQKSVDIRDGIINTIDFFTE